MVCVNFFHKPKSKKKLFHLGLILITGFCLVYLFHYLFFTQSFQYWNKCTNDLLFKLRYEIKGKEKIYPYIVHIDLADTDLENITENNDPPRIEKIKRRKNAFPLTDYYTTLVKVNNILRQLEAKCVIFDMLLTEMSLNEKNIVLNNSSLNYGNTYFPIIMSQRYKSLTFSSNTQNEIISKNLWYPQIINQGTPYSADIKAMPLIELSRSAGGLGHINLTPDQDGKNRSHPLMYQFTQIKNSYFPGLAFRATCDYLNIKTQKIKVIYGEKIILPNAVFPSGLKKNITIPINNKGQVDINWVGPWENSFPHFTVSQILRAGNNLEMKKELKKVISDSIVILSDVSMHSKDYGPGIFHNVTPHSSLHSHIANMILTQNFLIPLNTWQKLGFALFFAAILLLLAVKQKSYHLVPASFFLYIAGFLLNCLLFIYFGRLNDLLTFSLMYIICVFFVTTYLFFHEEQEKVILLTEKKTEYDRKNFVTYMSHELKSPLTIILGNLELLKESNKDSMADHVIQKINAIQAGACDLLHMNDLLLELNDFQSGKQNLNPDNIDFRTFISHLNSFFMTKTIEKNITYNSQIIKHIVNIFLNPQKIYKALCFLFFNSLQNTPENGRIEFKVKQTDHINIDKKTGEYLHICIKDSGPGIPAHEASFLLNSFDLVHCTHTRLFGKEGIKLYLVKQIVELHYGEFQIINNNRKGNEFNIFLPTGKVHLYPEVISNEKSQKNGIFTQNIKQDKDISVLSNGADRLEKYKDGPIINSRQKLCTILIADSNSHLRRHMKDLLKEEYNIIEAVNGKDILKTIRKKRPDLIICSVRLPEMDGITILENLKKEKNIGRIPLLLLTTTDEQDQKIMQNSKPDNYLIKPFLPAELQEKVKNLITAKVQIKFAGKSRKKASIIQLKNPQEFSSVITQNQTMYKMFKKIEQISGNRDEILITGETGVGKELIAGIIHKLSGVGGEFVQVNIAGVDDKLLSDDLFGHVKGAYTGAESDRAGKIEKAKHGTLFLDEIGDLALNSQVKLLRLLEQKTYYPIGSDNERKSFARIITATNANLKEKIEQGKFRRDLYYRLSTHDIHIPPLRERLDDLPLLKEHFFQIMANEQGKKMPFIPKELDTLLEMYHFPGNIRELKKIINTALSQHESRALSLEYFREYIRTNRLKGTAKTFGNTENQNTQPSITFNGFLPFREMEKAIINHVVKNTRGNLSIASEILEISVSTISRILKKNSEKIK